MPAADQERHDRVDRPDAEDRRVNAAIGKGQARQQQREGDLAGVRDDREGASVTVVRTGEQPAEQRPRDGRQGDRQPRPIADDLAEAAIFLEQDGDEHGQHGPDRDRVSGAKHSIRQRASLST